MFCRERWLLRALLLLGVIAGGRSEPQYVLTSPASLFSGEASKACVFLVGNKERLDVGLVLQHEGKNTTIIAEDVSSDKYYQCVDYKIPDAAKAVPVTLLLSAKGEKTEILERKTAVIKPMKNNCMFQMDKPLYQPGQMVHFRTVCLNSQMKPVNEKLTSVHLLDPSGAKIKQWPQPEMKSGVASFDFQLIKDAPPGSYRISANRPSSSSMSHWFSVEEYVPPRFSVTMDVPDTISTLDKTINMTVSAVYTYGKPVAATVTTLYTPRSSTYGRARNCYAETEDVTSYMTGRLGPDGVYKSTIPMTGNMMKVGGMSVTIETIVSEDDTGVQISNSRSVWVTTQPARLNFDYNAMKPHYKRNLPYAVKAQLVDEKDKPIPDQDIDIEVDKELVKTVKTGADGKIEHEIDTSGMVKPNMTIGLSYKNPDQCYHALYTGNSNEDYPTAEYTTYRYYSPSGSFLQSKPVQGELKLGETRNVEIQHSISQDALLDDTKKITLALMYQTRGRIVKTSHMEVDLAKSLTGTINVPITATVDMAPNCKVIVMALLKGELIVETIPVDVEKGFKNNVDMTFSAETVAPGSTAETLITGDPNSMCGLKVIDSSLLLMNRYDNFSPEGIYNLFSYWSYGYNIEGFNLEDPEPPCLDPNKMVFFNGNYYFPTSSDTEGDSYEHLKEAGLLVGTKLQTRKPKICVDKPIHQFKGGLHMEAAPVALKTAADRGFSAGAGGGGGGMVETLRNNFVDSLMWYFIPLDKDGHASLSEKFPDSITEWKGSAFCVSDKGGFGMTKSAASLKAFQPFFADVSFPSSLVRGESGTLLVNVRNYLDHAVKVLVDMKPSNDLTAELTEGTQNVCVKPNDQASFSWKLGSNRIGKNDITVSAQTTFIGKSCDGPNDDSQPLRKDTVVKTLTVTPEGIPQELTLSNLVFVKPDMKSTIPIRITPPSDVVPDSISAHITTVGDVIGLPLNNLEDLMKKPYGCGEHNLARVGPVIYMLDYLNATGQLKDETLQKGRQFILEAYYRQLGFAHGGAYKQFRTSDRPNSWLTVNGFKILEQAKRYVDIDETRQQQTLIWLENQQKLDNGCFVPEGSMPALQDSNSSVLYTANVVISLLESKYGLGKTLLEGGLQCLKDASQKPHTISEAVLMAYAFTLARLPKHRDPLMAKLMKKAIVKEGTIHWEGEDPPILRPVPFWFPIYTSHEVLLTSYMLLSMLGGDCNTQAQAKPESTPVPPDVAQKVMTTAAQTSLWLTRRQNSNGGFYSSMDTVVGLQAMTSFAKRMYVPNSQQTIRFKQNNGEIGSLNLNPENRLVEQRFDLSDVTANVDMEIEGAGWNLVQAVTSYNIPIPKENQAFSLSLTPDSSGCINGVAKAFNLTVSVSYHGKLKVSEMVMLQIKMLSGFSADIWSLKQLETNKVLSRADQNPSGDVVIFIENLTEEPKTFTFLVTMGNMALNLKAASGVVSDYTIPAENGYAAYEHPCTKHA